MNSHDMSMKYDAEWLIIGGGLAGCAAAYHLSKAGHSVIIAEAGNTLCTGASGNPAGALYPLLTADASATGRYFADALTYAFSLYTELQQQWPTPFWFPTGLLHMCNDSEHKHRLQKISHNAYYQSICRWVDANEASAIANATVDEGLFIYRSGYIFPRALCNAYVSLYQHAIRVFTNCIVNTCSQINGVWEARSEQNHKLISKNILLANAGAAATLFPSLPLPLGQTRGQLSYIAPTAATTGLRLPICRKGYILPAFDGYHVIGATYHRTHLNSGVTEDDHARNLEEALQTLPLLQDTPLTILGGRTSTRSSTRSKIPIIGAISEHSHTNLYASLGHGSRGLITTALPFLPTLIK